MAYKTMNELMASFRDHAAAKRWIEAHDVLIYMVQCGNLQAKLELARLYKDCTLLGIPQQERYRKAEFYYNSILNLLDLPDKVTATISMELAELYSFMKRPVGMLAMLLQAKLYGMNVPEREVDHARQLLMNLDINDFGKSARDAYTLGLTLSMAGGSVRLTELLLREASESTTEKLIRGKAFLALADFYNDRRNENYIYAGEAARCYRQATEAGFPEYLSRHNRV